MKEEDEESEGLKKIEQIMKYYIWLHYKEKWSLNLLKMWKNKEIFNLVETLIMFVLI
jgi:hypothetical protein